MDTQCKKWRLRADVLNDLAIFIELLLSIPWVRQFSLIVLSFSSCAKSIVGVAGGATRAALTQHQVIFKPNKNIFYMIHCILNAFIFNYK